MKFIGVYNYTVVLTYISLLFAIFGIVEAFDGNSLIAIICLVCSGICDAFDGTVARTKKDRTDDQKAFGIQIDSLCDVISFGVCPALICYTLGVQGILGLPLVMFYSLVAVIRLAFFNVLEAKRQQVEEGGNKTYRGLPVTSAAIILPIVYLFKYILNDSSFTILLHLYLLIVGFLFIYDFPLKKPNIMALFKKEGNVNNLGAFDRTL